MGTRALVHVLERDVVLVTMYKHWDGYPKGFGFQLAEFLADFTIVNGLGTGQPKKVANGMDCLAAQIVAHFKKGPGDMYIRRSGEINFGEEFVYEVSCEYGEPYIRCIECGYGQTEIFYGPASQAAEEFANADY